MKRIAILGCTGSIGRSALAVVEAHPDRLRVVAIAAGENVERHQVMAASEEAGLALDLLVEMRNKVVEAYRTMINMQS